MDALPHATNISPIVVVNERAIRNRPIRVIDSDVDAVIFEVLVSSIDEYLADMLMILVDI